MLAKPAAPMSGISASFRQAAEHALAVAVQNNKFAWILDISQGVLAVDPLGSGCLHGSACGFRKKRIGLLTQVKDK
jgi:hypothetical protein